MNKVFNYLIASLVIFGIGLFLLMNQDLLTQKNLMILIVVSIFFSGLVYLFKMFDAMSAARGIQKKYPDEKILLRKTGHIQFDYQEISLVFTDLNLHLINHHQDNKHTIYSYLSILDYDVFDFMSLYFEDNQTPLHFVSNDYESIRKLLDEKLIKKPVQRFEQVLF